MTVAALLAAVATIDAAYSPASAGRPLPGLCTSSDPGASVLILSGPERRAPDCLRLATSGPAAATTGNAAVIVYRQTDS